MAKKIVLMEHSRGNHTPYQVYNHGRVIFKGNATEAKKELREMARRCRYMWHFACTNATMRDYVAYEMADTFAIDITDGTPKWFIW